MRKDLVSIGMKCIRQLIYAYLQLNKVQLVPGDVRDNGILQRPEMKALTHLYANNLVFAAETNRALEKLALSPSLKAVMLFFPLCPRPCSRCSRSFCSIWALAQAAVERRTGTCLVAVGHREIRATFLRSSVLLAPSYGCSGLVSAAEVRAA
ncbi:TPA: hypothetical protein N0F65_008544 [Lagenidium giganteum]|uniref:Uncharacterized protein n=1 Tax=Lagenidium giganteum TaxID=4803 RepID=A0AAV2YLF1_9STRA|nr:TPA: hypothetical protein N0F65_008544 [Lagenidium giganteum]